MPDNTRQKAGILMIPAFLLPYPFLFDNPVTLEEEELFQQI
jgi:hypothetical protein